MKLRHFFYAAFAAMLVFAGCEKEQESGGKIQKPVTQIKEIQSAGTYSVLGTVAAEAKDYYVITDGTANIALYTADIDLKVGDKVLVEGSVQRGKDGKYTTDAWQFASPSCTVVSSGNQVAHSPVEYDGQMIEAALGGVCSCPEVKFSGKFYKNGTYYNIYIKGTSKQAGFYYQEAGSWDEWDGKNVIVKAYLIQQYNYFNVVPYEVVEDPNPAPFITSISATELDFTAEGGEKTINVGLTTDTGCELSATSNNEAFTASVSGNVITVTAAQSAGLVNAILTVELKADGKVVDSYEVKLSQSAPLAEGNREVLIDFPTMGFSNAEDLTVIEQGGLTLTFDKGSNSNAPKYYDSGTAARLYGGNSVTITGGTINTVKLTFGSSDGENAINVSDGTFDAATGIWTGSTPSLTLTIDGTKGNRRIQKMSVVYLTAEAGGEIVKASRNLAFSKAFVNVVLGEEFVAPTLSGNADGVVYSSSNADVATVDPATGAVTIVALGTAVITAAAEESETLLAGSVSYTLNVVEAGSSTDENVIADGKYWIVSNGEVAIPLTTNYGYLKVTNGKDNTEDNAFLFTYVSSQNAYTIQDKNGNYYYQTGSYNSYNKAESLPESGAYWSIEKYGDLYKITNVEVNKWMQYDASYSSYGSYDTEKGALPQLIAVTDGASVPYVVVSTENLNVDASATTAQFAISADMPWTAEVTGGTATLSVESGSADAAITVSFSANESTESGVKYVVTVKSAYGDKVVTINQAKISNADAGDVVFYETFDGCANGTSFVNNASSSTDGSIKTDNEGWSFTKGYEAYKCAKFGTSSSAGSATTPALGEAGDLELSFKATPWLNDKTTLKLSVIGGGTLSVESVTMATEFTEHVVTITGATAATQVVFEAGGASKYRFFLDDVKVVKIAK